MLNFYIITIFPDMFQSYFNYSIIKRAQEENKIKIHIINLRDYAADKRGTIDDTPYGGGAGMVMKVEPIFKAVREIKKQIKDQKKIKTILFSAKGKTYVQQKAVQLTQYKHIILICGRYEGVDERVAHYIADEEISLGDYVLTGGEIPAMALVDSTTRLLAGVLGNSDSLKEESFSSSVGKKKYLEYPQYTKPNNFKGWKVPEVLLSGDHKAILSWRQKNKKIKK